MAMGPFALRVVILLFALLWRQRTTLCAKMPRDARYPLPVHRVVEGCRQAGSPFRVCSDMWARCWLKMDVRFPLMIWAADDLGIRK